MKLYIQGGGDAMDSYELDKKFSEALDKNKPLLYIPIAMDPDVHPYNECFDWIKSTLKPFGITDIEMWTEDDFNSSNYSKLKKYSGVYIGGGNTFKLLKILKDSYFVEQLRILAENNTPLYGGSAGGVIMAKTIFPALSADKNDVNLTEFSGLNFVKNYDLWFHYYKNMDKQIKEYMKKYSLKKVIALPENAGLCVIDTNITTVGPGVSTIFPEIEILNPGTELKFFLIGLGVQFK